MSQNVIKMITAKKEINSIFKESKTIYTCKDKPINIKQKKKTQYKQRQLETNKSTNFVYTRGKCSF